MNGDWDISTTVVNWSAAVGIPRKMMPDNDECYFPEDTITLRQINQLFDDIERERKAFASKLFDDIDRMTNKLFTVPLW